MGGFFNFLMAIQCDLIGVSIVLFPGIVWLRSKMVAPIFLPEVVQLVRYAFSGPNDHYFHLGLADDRLLAGSLPGRGHRCTCKFRPPRNGSGP
jgi:hypothetical protein